VRLSRWPHELIATLAHLSDQVLDSYLFPLFMIRNRRISWFSSDKMMLARTTIRKLLVWSLFSLLLCGVVASEFPELLTLTDNASNDFTVRKTSTEGLLALPGARGPVRIADINSSVPATTVLHSRLIPFEKAAPVPSELFILHSVLRT
jgi:hypothetical protein